MMAKYQVEYFWESQISYHSGDGQTVIDAETASSAVEKADKNLNSGAGSTSYFPTYAKLFVSGEKNDNGNN